MGLLKMCRKALLINLSFLIIVLFAVSCRESGKLNGDSGKVNVSGNGSGLVTHIDIVTDGGIISLSWTAPSSYSDNVMPLTVTGFKLYYGVAQRTYTTVLDLSTITAPYQLTNLPPSETGSYYFAVTAYDASGNESDYSNELYI